MDPFIQEHALGTHAANPTPRALGNSVVRVYFNARDESGRSRVGWADVSLRTPETPEILAVARAPVLSPRRYGYFDDDGTSVGSIVTDESGKVRLYYVGWNRSVTVPWRNAIGCAEERPSGNFAPVSPAPILDRNPLDPFSLSYPWVMRTSTGWRMWYGTNTKWGPDLSDMRHVIRCASSKDGLIWRPDPEPAISLATDAESAVVRPTVIKIHTRWHMWYSHKGPHGYRIGHADSIDGWRWHRTDNRLSLSPSGSGPESQEVCYPAVFEMSGAHYMLYNGDGYGRTGFGLAVLK